MLRTSVIYTFDETTQGWAGEGAVAVTRVTSPVYQGLGALQISDAMTAGFDSMRFNDGSGLRDLSGNGTTITAWVYVPADATGTNWQAHLELQDPSFNWQAGPALVIIPGHWTKLTYQPPTSLLVNCRAMGVQVEANDVNRTQAVYFDFVVGETMTPSTSRWGGFLTTTPDNTLLDLPVWQGQRALTFTFEVVDGVTGENKGWFHPARGRTPRLSHDSSRTISRSVDLTFTPADSMIFDALVDRVSISMLLSDGTTWPLGRYMATDKTRLVLTSGEYASVQFVDEMFMIDQAISQAFSPAIDSSGSTVAKSITAVIKKLLFAFPELITEIEDTPYLTTSSWSIGTSRARILKDLATQGGYLAPWFGNHGRLKMIRTFDLATTLPTIDFDTNPRISRDSISRSDDVLSATNRFIVVSNSGLETTPRVGVYDVPSSAPYSADNRGFVVPEIFDIKVETQGQASAAARTIGQQTEIYERVEFDSTIDPRHDSYDVCRWNGDNWLELSWSMELTQDGTMSHTLRKVYT